MAAIVRCLWGESSDENPTRWRSVQRHIVKRAKYENCPIVVYVYGKANAELLYQNGFKHIQLLHNEPYPTEREVPSKVGPGWVKRRHPWSNKIKMLLQAFDEHKEIIYCDWDVPIHIRNPDKAFIRLARHGSFGATFSKKKNKRPLVPWRATKEGKRTSVSGNWLHFRDRSWLSDCLAKMDYHHDWWNNDELVFDYLVEQQWGSWPDDKNWLIHFETPIMLQWRGVSPYKSILGAGELETRTIRKETPIPFEWERMFGTMRRNKPKGEQ